MIARIHFVRLLVLLAGVLLTVVVIADDAGETTSPKKDDGEEKALDYIAIVDGEKIGIGEYISALRRGMRKRFYHGKIPDEEQKKFRKEVAGELVDRKLLIREAKRRGIAPDDEAVATAVKKYDEKFKENPDWPAARDEVLAQLKGKLEDDSLVLRLEEKVRQVSPPTEDGLKQFYEASKDLFTTPERVRVSLIMLRVDPSSPSDVWQQAGEEATAIVERINHGADFAELARIHSSDESAQNGGDMGYIHAGMLGANAQKVLDIMEPGEVSAPVVLLEGIAIFRLDDRQKPRLNPFEVVKERADKLYIREMGEKAWKGLLADLRSHAKIELNDAPWR